MTVEQRINGYMALNDGQLDEYVEREMILSTLTREARIARENNLPSAYEVLNQAVWELVNEQNALLLAALNN